MNQDKNFIKTKQRLKELREKKGISHETLSQILKDEYNINISGQRLRDYEITDVYHSKYQSTKGMRIEYLYSLAKYFNVSTDYLLGLTDSKAINIDDRKISDKTGLTDKTINILQTLLNPYQEQMDLINYIIQKLIKTDMNYSILDDISELLNINQNIISSCNNSTLFLSDLNFEETEKYSKVNLEEDNSLKDSDIIDTPFTISGRRYKKLLLHDILMSFMDIIKDLTLCDKANKAAKNYYNKKEGIDSGND